MRTSVSIVIPFYANRDTIERAVQSALKQSYAIDQVICVSDGSSDGSLEIVRGLAEQNENVSLLEQENRGASVARNLGWRFSNSDYIQFLDADDELLPTKVEDQVRLIGADEVPPDLIVGNYIIVDELGKEVKIEVEPTEDPIIALMKGRLGCTCSNLFRRTALKKVNGWNEELKSSQETDLMFRILVSSKIPVKLSPDCDTLIHASGSDRISVRDPAGNVERRAELRGQILQYVLEQNGSNNVMDAKQCFFDSLRELYPYNRNLALQLFKKHLRGFIPKPSAATSKLYVKTFRLFGFQGAEKIKSLFS